MHSAMQFIITFATRGTVVQQAVVGKFMASKMTAPETALSARVTNHTAPSNGRRWTVHPKPSGVCICVFSNIVHERSRDRGSSKPPGFPG